MDKDISWYNKLLHVHTTILTKDTYKAIFLQDDFNDVHHKDKGEIAI